MKKTNWLLAAAACLAAGIATTAVAAPTVLGGYEITPFASGIGASTGMTFGPDGNLYVNDYSGRVLRVDATGAVTVVASGVDYLTDIAFTTGGRAFVTSGGGQAAYEVIDGQLTLFRAGLSYPTSIEARGDELYIANSGSGVISRLLLDGTLASVLTTPSAPNGPFGLSFDAAGNLYYNDHGTGSVYRYDFLGSPQLLASTTALGGTFTGLGFDDRLFFTDTNLGQLLRLDADGTTEVFGTGFAAKGSPPVIGPQGIAYAGGDSMFVADGDFIWKIRRAQEVPEPDGRLLWLAGLVMVLLRARRASAGAGLGSVLTRVRWQ